MWVLIVSLFAHQPLGQVQSKGIIHAPMQSHELCLKEKDRVNQHWHMDGYRTSARCIYVKHYSEHNGAYSKE